MVSKALVSAMYRKKIDELTRLGVDVVAVVPPVWREAGTEQRLEGTIGEAYRLIVSPLRLNSHFHLHYYPGLPRVIRSVRPDILHLDEEPYNLATFLGSRTARTLGIPSIFFTWQNIPRRYPPPFAWAERATYRMSAGALAGSQTASAVLREKGFSARITVVPQFGVDPEVFHPESRLSGAFTVGMFNRLIPGKAPLLAIEAFASLPPEARMLIAGDGPMRRDVELDIGRRGLSQRATLRPRVPSFDMPQLMRSVDVVVLPSITTDRWKEQFGRVLIEAMASGIPVIGSDSGEIPGVIGDAGVVVPENDVGALGGALRRLYDDPDLRLRLSEAGRRRAVECFSNRRVARLTLDAYEHAIGASHVA